MTLEQALDWYAEKAVALNRYLAQGNVSAMEAVMTELRLDNGLRRTSVKTESNVPSDPVIEAVRADLLRRQQLGFKKYGGTLASNPASLRDKLQHSYEEALDLCNYLKWAILELEGFPDLQPDTSRKTGLEL